MNIISIDLGTTNIKVTVYDQKLHLITTISKTVVYDRNGDFVEFDCGSYFDSIKASVIEAARIGYQRNQQATAQIVLTGQAESLILLDDAGIPVHPAISWLDMRSRKECEELQTYLIPNYAIAPPGSPG